MKGWRIYYGDGTVFTSEDGTPYDAPRTNVQIIVQEKDGDYEMVQGRDHFYYEPRVGGWCTCDLFGCYDHLIRAERQCLLLGRQMMDDEYRELNRRVREEIGERHHKYARECDRDAGR